MKTKILLIASGVILTAGIAMHTGNGANCPFGKPCQKLFKSETAVVKSEKKVELAKAETGTLEKE